MSSDSPLDEMADGTGHAKPHWRSLLSTMFALGHETLAQRARLLDQAFADEGITAILPGERAVNWRCDPIPLLISAAEFSSIEAGLAQRAQLMELILADLYGPRTLMAEGLIPPDLVYGNPAYLRPCRTVDVRRRDRHLMFYAADMLRGPDGAWRVLADRTGQTQGLAYALENRRIMARVVPELFQSQRIRQLRQHLEVASDALQALSPDDGAGVALLSSGHSDPLWFEHVLLSRRNVDRPGRGRRPDAAQRPGVPQDAARPATDRRADAPQGRPSRRFVGIVGRNRRSGLAGCHAKRLCPHGQRSRLRAWPRPPLSPHFSPRSPAGCLARICNSPARPQSGWVKAPWCAPSCAIWKAG